jgi:hypothetical protein
MMDQIWQALLAPLDRYCERIDPSFWAEPLNFLSNIGFVALALRLYFLAANSRIARRRQLRWLAAIAFAIGIGSGLFHSIPNLLTQIADVAPICLFVLLSVLFYFKQLFDEHALDKKTIYFVIASLAFFPLLAKVSGLSQWLAGGEAYLGIAPSILILALSERKKIRRHRLLLAGLGFIAAYAARTLDPILCESFPYGTHFFWHLMTATVAYLMASLQILGNEEQGQGS